MSNVDAVNELLTAINFDRFTEIEARHNPDVVFTSFRGPTLRNAMAVSDWHREFLRDYADCSYSEMEYVEEGDTVVVRATIQAKGYDWRAFSQRVVETFRFVEGGLSERRLYAMLPDLELDKPAAAAMANATGFRGGNASTTRTAVEGFYGALLKGDGDGARAFLHEKAAVVDGVYGVAVGPEQVMGLLARVPRPLFGAWRLVGVVAGAKDAAVELVIDADRPRAADWVRVVDGKIAVIEGYWMLREIGVDSFSGRRDRQYKQVILPK